MSWYDKKLKKYVPHESDRWAASRLNSPTTPLRPVPETPITSLPQAQLQGEISLEAEAIGRLLHETGQATITDMNHYSFTVSVSEYDPLITYTVGVRVVQGSIKLECNCPFGSGQGKPICGHKLAGLYVTIEKLGYRVKDHWESALQPILAADAPKPVSTRHVLVFSLANSYYGWRVTPFGVPANMLKDVDTGDSDAVAHAIIERSLGHEAKTLASKFVADRYVNIGDTGEVIARLLGLMENTNYYYRTDVNRANVFPMMRRFPFFLGGGGNPLAVRLTVSDVPAVAEMDITETPLPAEFAERAKAAGAVPGLTMLPVVTLGDARYPLEDETGLIPGSPPWILLGTALHPVSGTTPAFMGLANRGEVRVPGRAREAFLTKYVGQLAEHTRIQSDVIDMRDVHGPPVPRVYLTDKAGELIIHLLFSYDNGVVETEYAKTANDLMIRRHPESGSFVRVHRDMAIEGQYWSQLSKFGLKRGDGPEVFALKANMHPIDFLIHQVPRIAEAGYEVFGEESLKSIRVNRNRPKISFTVSSQIDWFDLNAQIDFGGTQASFADLRKAVRKRERYVKLTDGTIGQIPEEWLKQYRHLFALGEDAGESLKISDNQLIVVEDAIALADGVQADPEFERKRDRLRGFSNVAAHTLPPGFVGELRPYQKAGYDWLHFLHEYEFGGILADDMGIGKTVQALTFLLSLRESGHTKSANLIVVPRSILFNWEREAKKFTPGLRVLTHSENHRAREGEFDGYDLVLTTYGVMLRDVEILNKYKFHYVVLDESQAIKNPMSITGRAARRLNCEHRLALTGTPVENGTIELWSQFAFVNPGLLGNMESFRTEFATAIEKGGDEATADLLRRMVFPFILRRTKDQVATDLPPRTERVVIADMEPSQRALYDQTRDRYRDELLNTISKDGIQQARMKMLEALLRLRQMANHPALVDKWYTGPAAKFELLRETLDTLRAEGHKALVFSQFVQMLTLVRKALDADGIPYAYLDGRTKDRQERVDAFQNDPNLPFFLISLKAGGTGLNLTAADYVIHIDPWWNPAVERQATDRTHRIGQDKPVFVYKLITRDTVEEKILELQDRKRKLANQLVATEEGFFKSLTADDVAVLFE